MYKTNQPNSAALAFLVMGAFWFMTGTVYGLFSAMHLVSPELFAGIPALIFSRVRPVHINTVIYGFVATTLIGCGLYWTPALLKTRLWSERLGWAGAFFWNLTVLSGPFTFSVGMSQGREYAEYLWIFDMSLILAVLLLLLNAIMTILNRVEKSIYVSIWYSTGMLLWTAGVYPIGNVVWHPSTGAMPGLLDSLLLWFYGHNLVGLILTPLAVGAAYFVIPRAIRRPINSHTLSLVGFWTLVLFYTHIGGHHILQTPIPNWLKVMSVSSSLAMVVPVFVALLNLWLTARGHAGKLLGDPAGRLVMAGTFWYLLVCIQGPFQSIPFVQRVTHLNNWTIGHSHIAVLGFSGFIALGALWHVLPYVLRKKIWSLNLVNLQFGLVLTGLMGFLVALTIAGLIQGQAWNNGELVYRVLPEIFPYMVARLSFGLFIIASSFIGFLNLVMTMKYGEPFKPQPVGATGEES